MTPILLPLATKSDIKNHGEARYLLRSALKYVKDPWFIIIGHRPDWLAVDKGTTKEITEVGRVTHIEMADLPSTNPDHNMARKIFEGCKHLKSCGHVGGFIRVSDDNLFLAPYQPTIWVGDSIERYLFKIDGLKALARQNGSINGLTNSHAERMRRYLVYMKNVIPLQYANFDTHVPMWYFSPDSFIEFYTKNEGLFHADRATINSAYYNSSTILPLLDNNRHLIQYWLPKTKEDPIKIGWINLPIDAEFILKFIQDLRAPRWPLLGYAAQATKGPAGKNFIQSVDRVFNVKTEFEVG